MKNIKALLLLCLPFLAVTACDYTPSPVNPSSIESIPSEGQSTSEVDPYYVDADIWMEYFDTFEAFYIDKNYSISMHVTGEMDGEQDDWNVEVKTFNYAMKRISWDANHPEDKNDPADYLVSSKRKTTPTSFEADDVHYDESRGEYVCEESCTIDKDETVAEYVLPFKKYSSFVYDPEDHYFKAVNYKIDYADLEMVALDVQFKFYEGKLVTGDMELISTGDKDDYFYHYDFTFGDVLFEVPDYTKL